MTARGLAPLRHRGFRFLVAGQLGSNVGDAFYAVALPWYVLATHGGARGARLRPAPFFPLAAITLAAALLAGLSQRTWRNFGAITPSGAGRPDASRLSTASTPTDSAVHAS